MLIAIFSIVYSVGRYVNGPIFFFSLYLYTSGLLHKRSCTNNG